MTEYYLWLLQVMGVANPRSIQLIKHFGDPEKVYRRVENGEKGFLKNSESANLKSASLERSESIIRFCEKRGTKIISLFDEEYPELLRNIYNPPILLFADGGTGCLNNEICLTIIGTRKPSDYSVEVTETISKKLAELGITIVSGFALGVDKSAQLTAADSGGKTAGVLACGIDVDYPRGSLPFRRRVAESGGAVISELLPGTGTDRGYFHLRNRIMSGLSLGTLIIEAGQASGCHITAGYALSQNRDLFCIPPANVFLERYSGVVRYLRDGAIPVFSYIDIVQQYKTGLEMKIYESEQEKNTNENSPEYYGADEKTEETEKTEKTEKKHREKRPIAEVQPETAPPADYSSLSPTQRQIVELLQKCEGAATLDFITQNSGLDLNTLSDALLDMELDGIVENLPGARYKTIHRLNDRQN